MGTAAALFDRATAVATLGRACAMAGLDPAGAELIRLGTAAVFRLRREPVIARIGRKGGELRVAEREICIARWLAREGVPASRALDLEQPILVDDAHIATFWESASDVEEYGSTEDLAHLLRQLHALSPDASVGLPPLDPFHRSTERIESSPALDDRDRAFLQTRQEELASGYHDLEFGLPTGVIHGDASVGNVIKDRRGRPLLVDLAGIAIGPREWDLILTAIYFDRFGWHTSAEYVAFVTVIGYDVMTWPGYPVLGDVREFLMVTWLARTADNATKAAELTKRISSLRSNASRRDWRPF